MKIVERPHSGKGVAAKVEGPALKPRDAATLIMVRRDAAIPRVLMGKRSENHALRSIDSPLPLRVDRQHVDGGRQGAGIICVAATGGLNSGGGPTQLAART